MKPLHPSPLALLLIRSFEGLRLTAYQCPSGIWTIGYGHTDGVTKYDTITKQEAEYLLGEDIRLVANFISNYDLDLRQFQFDALISFVFNIGNRAFASSTILAKIKANPNDPTIRDEFRRWIYSNGVVLEGLKRRREEEIRYYFNEF